MWLFVWLACSRVMASSELASAALGGEMDALTLAEAKRIALLNNWDLLGAVVGVDAAAAQRIVASEYPNPALSLSTTQISVDRHPSSDPGGNGFWDRNYDTVFAINQLFEIGGKRRNRKASAQAAFEASRANFLDAKRTLDLAVTKAYAAASQAEAAVLVLQKSAESLEQEAKLAQVRLQAGEISSADKGQIEIASERFRLDAETARANAAQARVALEVLLGVSRARGEVTLTDRLEDLCASPPPSLPETLAWRRPDIVAAEAALSKAEADVRLQRANRIPDPTVLAQYEHLPPDTPNTVGFGVSFPIPLWNRNRGNILAAQAAREQARLALERTRAQAAAELTVARISYEEAHKKWERYRDQIRPKSEAVSRAIAYSYQKGGSSLLDMLVAQRNDNEVRLAATQAASDTVTALAALQAASTQLPNVETNK